MQEISSKEFFKTANEDLKNKLQKHLLQKVNDGFSKGDEGAVKYEFNSSNTLIVAFYKMNEKGVFEYEFYHGEVINDFILDKLNSMKEKAESKGKQWIWGK